MSGKPRFAASVIIPTYNREEMLYQNLRSLQASNISKDDFEIIVVDDGSLDNTHEVVRNFAGGCQIRYVYQEDNGYRAGRARNLGIELAEGAVCILLDCGIVVSQGFVKAHIDAHCDTGGSFDQTKFHHGGPFRNAVLDGVLDPSRTIQIGIRGSSEYLWEFSYESGMTVIHAEEISGLGIPAIIEKARRIVGDGPTYLSFDIDSLDPAFAPGTGTPEVGGFTTREVLEILRGLKGVNLVGGDVVEVAPQYDATTNTAHAGAQVLFEILSLMVFSPFVNGKRD